MKKNSLTVIFMKDTNRPLTYQISVKLLIFVVVLLAGIASTYAFFIKGYYSLYKDNQQLETIIRSLKTETGSLQSTLDRLLVTQAKTDEDLAVTEEVPPQASVLSEAVFESTGMVAIEGLKIGSDRSAGSLSFTFDLRNTTGTGILLRGYLFVVLKTQNNKIISSFPEVGFKEGFPVDYHQGDLYAIRRFKGYRGELKLSLEAGILEILVYSDTGKLIAHVREPVPAS
ncbi:MAG: hypothetical protein FVQ81_06825 [Candidatus Glassbacteria bacterium]|nr:hypothetical protein [Candidatus Glassbacteria bacterium]